MSYLSIENVEKSFGALRVVRDFTLDIAQGEFVSLLGPSGCGKTTVLRMVAGFETPSAGAIRIEGHDIVGTPPARRQIGMVFQAYALFPNLTVADNVGFGLRIAGMARAERAPRVAEMLDLVGLGTLGARYPFQLSGGQQQRVALARALAPRPRVLLLDEPLSALDAKIRVSLRTQIREIQARLGITTLFVTHDQEEALTISDRIVVMNGGVAEQAGTPFEVYNRPSTSFVANFVGTLNTFRAVALDAATVRIGEVAVALPGPVEAAPGSAVALALRPESLRLGRAEGREVVLPGRILDVDFLGSVIRIRAEVAGTTVALDTFNRPDTPPPPRGAQIEVSLSAADLIRLDD